jgi:hypothetical protein
MDAMDRQASAIRYHGCLIVELYNAVRPHMSLNYLTPIEFKQQDLFQPSHQTRAIPQE